MRTYNWGILGLGNIAGEFAAAMNALGRPVFAAASRRPDASASFGRQYAVEKFYDTYEELLSDPDVDIVYIALVNNLHYEWIMAALSAGKHVLCEKAIWGNKADMDRAYALAEEKGLFLAEAMTIHHMPLFRMIKEKIRDGVLGKIKFVEAELGSLKEDDPGNRFFNPALGGGAMLDIGTYGLSFVEFFLEGELTDAVHVMCPHPGGADEMWGISLKTDAGQIGSVNVTFRAKLPKRGIIAGDKAYISVMNYVRADKALLVFPDGREEVLEAGSTPDALQYEILDMEKAIETDDPALTCAEYTRKVVALMDRFLGEEELHGE